MNKTIFKEYDIRGVVDEDFNADDVYSIARAFGSIIARNGAKTVCTTYDGRETSPEFADKVNLGLKDCGLKVYATGLGTSPMNYFAIHELNTDAGVMITASHNPKEYNGIKPSLAKAESFFGENIQKLIPIIEAKDFVEADGGLIEEVDIKDKYVARMVQDLDVKRPIKVVWDNGNGAGGEIIQKLVVELPGEHTVLYGEIDGNFPNHHPDPSAHKNLKDLQKKVVELGADLGVAFDGDADRLGAVTNKGEVISNDLLLAMFAREELKKYPEGLIIGDVKCSKVMFDKIEEFGGKALIWKTGHVHAKDKLKELDGVLAGEVSGHFMFHKGFYGHDDGVYAAIKAMNLVANSAETLSEMLASFPKTFSTEEARIEVPEEDKFSMMNKLAEIFKSKTEFHDIIDIDGVRATSDDGIVMLRASNTQNVLSLRCESLSGEEGLRRLIKGVVEDMKSVGVKVEEGDIS